MDEQRTGDVHPFGLVPELPQLLSNIDRFHA